MFFPCCKRLRALKREPRLFRWLWACVPSTLSSCFSHCAREEEQFVCCRASAGKRRPRRTQCLRMQVAGFLAFFTCSFIPVIAYPAYKASTADPNKVSRGSEAGFSKTGMWGQIDK